MHLRTLAAVLLFTAAAKQAQGQAGLISCPPNIDFSFGNFNNWDCFTGTAQSAAPAGTLPLFGSPVLSGPLAGPPSQHLITSGFGTDYYGGFSGSSAGWRSL